MHEQFMRISSGRNALLLHIPSFVSYEGNKYHHAYMHACTYEDRYTKVYVLRRYMCYEGIIILMINTVSYFVISLIEAPSRKITSHQAKNRELLA